MSEILKVCICGGGNLAHALSAVIGTRDSFDVTVLTRQPHRWKSEITAIYKDQLILRGKLSNVTADPEAVIPEVDIVILALPRFAHEEVLKRIAPFLSNKTWVGSIPAWGGFDWQARRLLGENAKIFGTHRISHICRTVEYGSAVEISGVSPELFIGGAPTDQLTQVTEKLEDILSVPSIKLDNFLPVTLTPSNSFCHPVRLYSLLKEWQPGKYFERVPGFYKEWDSYASELLFGCGEELQQICKNIPLDLTSVPTIFAHYGVSSIGQLTRRIQELTPLAKIQAPFLEAPKGYAPNLQSRFFTEDISYGLMAIAGIGRIAGVKTPLIDSLVVWGQDLLATKYINSDGSFGEDTASLPIPQSVGIKTLSDLVREASR